MAYTAPNVLASGTTFAQFQSGGLSGHLEKLITANSGAGTAPSSAPTLSETGSGGTLPTATYYVVITESDGFGETTASPVSSSQAITVGQNLVVTFPTLQTGNTSRNTYVGTASTGPFTLAASGTTASTVTISAPLPTNSYAKNPPTVNSTSFSYTDANGNVINKTWELIRAGENGNLQDAYNFLRKVIEEFNSGQPVSFSGVVMKLRHAHAVFAMLNTLCSEMGTLIDANAGTLGTAATGIGGRQSVRTWP